MRIRNREGYNDPTAYYGAKEVVRMEAELEGRVTRLVRVVREIADIAGFDVVGRITFRHKKNGRVFK